MNKRLFIFVILLMGISLAGIILLQMFWIRNAISIREEYFNKSVNMALRETADKLESHENISHLSDRFSGFYNPKVIVTDRDSLSTVYRVISDSTPGNTYHYNMTSKTEGDYVVSVWTGDDEEEILSYKHDVKMDSLKRSIALIQANIQFDSLSQFITNDIVFVGKKGDTLIDGKDTVIEGMHDSYAIVKKAKNLNEAFIKMAYVLETTPVPIEERIDSAILQELLTVSLFDKGIQLPFEYGILHIDSLKSLPVRSAGFDPSGIDKRYMVSIFPNELVTESNYLVIQFPGRNIHLLKSMAWTLAGSLLLTLIILVTFAITIFMILRQKKLSDIKSDFINNMTHEFKTPIATISLAVDSINSPKIIGDEKEVRYYTGIIKEENRRMNNQVESVLRMSLLDKHDLEFNIKESDMHHIISQAVSKVSLLLKERNGEIKVDLDSEDPVISIDEDHMTNALLNLLDNAIKYSEGAPEITVSCTDTAGGLLLSISDKGMGMSKDVVHRIFDKFYRKPSGNIHNIKGFGLGLSYVKAVIDAFNGKIVVKSEPGKGSIFDITLPKNNK